MNENFLFEITEFSVEGSLPAGAFGDHVNQIDEEEERQRQIVVEGLAINSGLYNMMGQILSDFGTTETIEIVTGSGGGFIGAKLEHAQQRVTPYVEICVDDQTGRKMLLRCIQSLEPKAGFGIGRNHAIQWQLPPKVEGTMPTQQYILMAYPNRQNNATGYKKEEITSENVQIYAALLLALYQEYAKQAEEGV